MAVLNIGGHRRPRPWHPALASIPVGVTAAAYGLAAGGDWRLILASSPRDPGPAAGLLVVAVLSGFAILVGLALLLANRGAIGPVLFALGVGLSCGVATGFFIDPAVLPWV